jgi:hypothetical protein
LAADAANLKALTFTKDLKFKDLDFPECGFNRGQMMVGSQI